MDNKYTILNITNEKILNLMVNVLFYFSIPLVGVSFLRIPKMGFLPVMYLHVALALVVSINYLFRKRFNFNLKATVILFTFILIGIGGALTNNRVVSAIPTFLMTLMFASVFFNKRVAFSVQVFEIAFLSAFIFVKKETLVVPQEVMSLLSNIFIFGFMVIYTVSVIKDTFSEVIKNLKSRETELKKANAVKSKFLAMVSHEIRTPLNGIILSQQQFSNLSPENKVLSEIIESSSSSLLQMVNDLLDTTKLETGKFKIAHTKFNLEDLYNELSSSYSTLSSTRNFIFKSDYRLENTSFVGDRLRIDQITRNILNNSFKFTERGQVSLIVDSSEKGIVSIIVKDTGIGIDSSKIKNIFNEFEQEDEDTSILYGGSGLGLTIVEKLVTLLKGKISIDSTKGIGTTVRVDIPMDYADSIQQIKETKEVKIQNHNLKILIAEDNKLNAKLLIKLLENSGYKNLTLCKNGKEAFSLAINNHYDVFLLDVRMPVLSGIEATKLIRKECAINTGSYIIGVSANTYQEDIDEALQAGMDCYITKPIKKVELLSKLSQIKVKSQDAAEPQNSH